LVTVGVTSATQAVKRSRIAMEMHQITLALETYKIKFGEYPPDLYDKKAVVRHVKKRWPRFQLAGNDAVQQYLSFMKALDNIYKGAGGTQQYYYDNSTNPTTITREASYVGALPLWLGGFPNDDGKFAGFSVDPVAPFGKDSDGKINGTDLGCTLVSLDGMQDSDSIFYEMIIGKNIEYVTTKNKIVFPVLVNRDATVNKDGTTYVPYVYFKSCNPRGGPTAYRIDENATADLKCCDFKIFNPPYSELESITAYAKSGTVDSPVWHEPERFQLIHPGLDGIYGSSLGFRSTDGNNIGQRDFDNITNFSDYLQIKAILP
jgi:hypothetical protein